MKKGFLLVAPLLAILLTVPLIAALVVTMGSTAAAECNTTTPAATDSCRNHPGLNAPWPASTPAGDPVDRLMRLRFAPGYPTLTAEQARNAITIAQVARDLGVPRRGLQIAIATAIQESKLTNLDRRRRRLRRACSNSGPRPAGAAAPRSPTRCWPPARSSAAPSTPPTPACWTSPAGRTCR